MPDTSYVYQPEERSSAYDAAVAAIRARYPHGVETRWIDPNPHLEHICSQLRAVVPVTDLAADASEYSVYMEAASYGARYPHYYPGNIAEKSYEHFCSLRLLCPSPEDVLIDIASEGSPLPEIAQRLCGCRAYAQDIMYPAGINGMRIGGDACALPLPDGFASCITLTCSLEHFEGNSDVRLFRELHRVLRPNGRIVVIPLYMFQHAAIQTDPTYSAGLSIPFDEGSTLYCAEGWGNRHGRFYSPESLRRRIFEGVDMEFRVYRLLRTEAISAAIYARFCLVATKR